MPNRLAHEKSPYLRQHADNPVDWWPWGEAAFARARAEQKPVFLSIGYATCHWCHVMAHESFENPATAALLNEHFIAVKVDREERPDVDRVYMAYVQALTGHGGWPLSAWLTPELKPFYGGTYFPPQDRGNRAGFPSLLRAIAEGWQHEREKLLAESERVIGALRDYHGGGKNAPADEAGAEAAPKTPAPLAVAAGDAYEKGFQHFYEAFDATRGGFGGAPKFPRASNLGFLLRCAAVQGVASELGTEAVNMTAATLRAMARGGLHDHVGGGFHRYSVDESWFVPHFEKMLYDQAQIALNALDAWQATGDERHAWLVRDIFDYALRDLAAPAGGFYSAEDADSATAEGHHAEGAFYVWAAAELQAVLGADFPFFAAHYGITDTGNVPESMDPQREFTGKNILAQRHTLAETAQLFSLPMEQANDRLLAALAKLRSVRATRPRPLRDEKIVTAWNGLMISALARASAAPAEALAEVRASYLAAAVQAAEFVEHELWDASHGVLWRCWLDGRSAAEGFAEDYAFLAQGLLDLYEATFDPRWLAWAQRLQGTMDRLFRDEAHGGYFNSAADDPHLVLRLKEDYDGAEPAASSVAAMNLLRLGTMLHDEALRERGAQCIEAFRGQWTRTPHAMPQMLCALELALDAPRHVVLAGDPAAPDFRALAETVAAHLGPKRALLRADPSIAWTAAMTPIDGRAAAYVCEDYTCQLPVTEPDDLRRLLR